MGIDRDIHRPSYPDRISHLDLAFAGQASRDNVLGHVAGSIGGRAVHLSGILAGKSATAVGASAAVGVDDDLAAGQSAIALRATDDKAAGGVDQVLGVLEPLGRQHRLDDFLNDRFDEGRLHLGAIAHLWAVLARKHHGIDAVRLAVHIAHGHLAFGIGPQKGQAAVASQLGLAFDQAVGIVDGRRHELGGLVAGVAEHQALIAGPGVEVVVAGMVHALGDVIGLLVVADHDRATLVVDTVLGIVVTDAFDGVARDLDVVYVRVGGDLAGQHDKACVAQGLGGYP